MTTSKKRKRSELREQEDANMSIKKRTSEFVSETPIVINWRIYRWYVKTGKD